MTESQHKKGTPAKRKSTPSFVVELPLASSRRDERRLEDRLLCASRLSNVLLQEGLNIVESMRADPEWGAARKIKDIAAKRVAYDALKKRYSFTSAAFDERVAIHARAAGFYGRIGTHEMQATAKRVFRSLSEWVMGKRGRPRFKGRKRPLHSVEGKNNAGMLQWKDDIRMLQVEKGWLIAPILPNLDKDEWLWSALQAPTKYCRIVWRNINGRKRWFLQLVQEGLVPVKASVLARLAPESSQGGLDLGPSHIAWCTDKQAGLRPLAPEIERPERAIRRLQRQIDRQRRAANPDNFNADGTIRKGRKTWQVSQRQKANEVDLASLQRKEAAVRRNSHGQLIHFLLSRARHWKDDGVSPKALQKRYGKSVGKRAPGALMSELQRKAERAGGTRTIIDVRHLKTSQYDHTTGDFVKKSLSQRWHDFRDGRGKVQRDVYSAFLALHGEGSTHNPVRLEAAWQALASALSVAGLCAVKGAKEDLSTYEPASRFVRALRPQSCQALV